MKLVFNTTPLIYLAKAGLLPYLGDLPCDIITCAGVKAEAVERGKAKSASDALVIEKALGEGVLKVEEIRDRAFLNMLTRIPEIHEVDAEVLALAREVRGIAVIDEAVGRRVARANGISYAGTPFVLALLVVNRKISKDRARLALDEIVRSGWRCSAELYSKILSMIDDS